MTYYRHSDNCNLILTDDEYYLGYSVNCGVGKPIVTNYLERLINLIEYSHECYPRLLAMRFDLRFPDEWPLERCIDTQVVSKFTQALRGRIKNDRMGKVHESDVMFAWGKEIGAESGKPHYHFVILLNGNAYPSVVKLDPRAKNTFGRICQSWAGVLGVDPSDAGRLVNIPDNAYYDLKRGDNLNELIYRCSYLCKPRDKCYGERDRSFQTSAVPTYWQRPSEIESW